MAAKKKGAAVHKGAAAKSTAPPPKAALDNSESESERGGSESESESGFEPDFTKFTASEDEDMEDSDEEERSVARGDARESEGDDDSDEEDEEMMEKDQTEEELERLIFGDRTGFRQGLREVLEADLSGGGAAARDDTQAEETGAGDLTALADTDLFFFDAGPSDLKEQALLTSGADEDEDEADRRDPPAWEDSDDERIAVSLASVPQLRKLRITEAEDVVSGKEYTKRLRRQFERLYPVPEWVKDATGTKKRRRASAAGSSDEESSDDDVDMDEDDDISTQPLAKLLRDAEGLVRTANGPNKRRKLRPETLDIQRMKDVSSGAPSALTSLSFHPTLPLLLSSGPAATLYLHHIHPHPPHPNPLLTSLHIKRTPLTTTLFHPDPTDARVFLGARRRYFHIWNLETGLVEKISRVYGQGHEQRSMERFRLSPDGRYVALVGSARKGGGLVNLLDARTLQWAMQARVESRGGIADLAWWADGRGLTIAGKNGEVTEWSVAERRALARWTDAGAVGTTVLALGGRSGRDNFLGGDRWVAVGSSSGVVNLYDRRQWLGGASASDHADNAGVPPAPAPVRVLDQLTTPTSHLAFDPSGQVLAMASRWKRDALRLVHLPSATVYRNWPTAATPLGRITAVAWAPSPAPIEAAAEAILAVANEAGKIRLWEVRA